MNSSLIEDLVFDEISFYPGNSIIFTIKNTQKTYRLMLLTKDGKPFPQEIRHGLRGKECYCEFHTSVNQTCHVLTKYMDEIYEKLRKHPDIRLKLLF